MDIGVFLLALAMVYLLPGPDMLLLLHTGARYGCRVALATAVGLGVARGCHVALAATGLALLFRSAPWTFDVVRIGGGCYLALIGLQLLRAPVGLPVAPSAAGLSAVSYRRAFRRGLLTNLLNPKALLFCSVLLPQFIHPQNGPLALQFGLLGGALVVVGLGFDSFYAVSGDRMGRWLARHRTMQRVQQWGFGAVLLGFGARLALIRDL
ncbi:LysE family translocator [Pseudomonas sp. GD04087]|uniref:LysE family translocator n=1 Tax=unclassified Pseudomonas TaxID=196821 RepID=UPI00244B9514|nr:MULTISPECIES: LysE family translocator [unclassified Pseudomonas]MDH0293284.1 LysE family translocator [Pseudomonas sp. GD04087]MDH1050407.1 LysE family translocator [Pseudomonas sp. GD03903]MDH2003858.1 LysE family translocator [Pseudomonas sp. GD03691]